MTLVKFSEKRLSHRRVLNGLMPGKLLCEKGNQVDAVPRNVSLHGLAIESDTPLRVGNIVTLVYKDEKIELKVQRVDPGFDKKDKFYYGLVTLIENINLEKIFTDAGCLA